MRKIKAQLSIGFVGARHEEIFEFEDHITDEEIEQDVQDWAWSYIDLYWDEVE